MSEARRKNVERQNRLRERKRRRGLLTLLGCMVVVATAVALMLPALSMTRGVLACEIPEHQHSDACYEHVLTCDLEEGEEHLHSDVCYERQLVCGLQEHVHSDACYEAPEAASENGAAQGEGASTDAAAQMAAGQSAGATAGVANAVSDEAGGEAATAIAGVSADEGEGGQGAEGESIEVEGAENEVAEADVAEGAESVGSGYVIESEPELPMPAQSFSDELPATRSADAVNVMAEAPEGALPEGATMVVKRVEDADVIDAAKEKAVDEAGVPARRAEALAVDIAFLDADGNEVEPAADVRVTISTKAIARCDEVAVVHFDGERGAEFVDSELVGVSTADVAGVAKDSAAGSGTGAIAATGAAVAAASDAAVGTVTFDAASFSVYALVYTVDFNFEYNGKTFAFTLNGADAVSFSRLAEALGIAESYASKQDRGNAVSETAENGASEAQGTSGETEFVTADEVVGNAAEISETTKQFLEQVHTVAFSNPELLWVGRIEESATTGELLYRNDLAPAYPSGMSANEYGDYATREFSAPDWVLISLQPFDTEETLTITMKNGDAIAVKVTDAADAVMIDDGAGGRVVQTIANPSGTTIDLFDYWITNSLQYAEGMNGWPGHRGDAFSSWQFDHYNYYGQQQNGAVPMSQDPDRNNDWYVNPGSLRGNGNNQGINANHTFKFYPGAAGTVVDNGRKGSHTDWTNNHDKYTSINSWTGDADPTTGLVAGQLVNGYPQLTNNSNLGADGSSLAYLFDTSNHGGKQKYGEVNNLLYVDSEGYYTYDSRYYSASYDPAQGDGGNFVLREHAANMAQQAYGFWPFGSRVNWHGMHMNTQFSMPSNGQVLNPNGDYKDMQFEFSGDDDTWLYIDGVLVGDGGGIHNRTEIDINFATGTVIVTGTKDDNHQGTFTSTTTLRVIFEAAEQDGWVPAGYVAVNFEAGSDTFKAGTYHAFDMFYLERGGSESNLYIRYNLISTADFTAHKSYHSKDGGRLERDEFKFELVGLDGRYESVPDGTDDQGNTLYKLVEAAWSNDAYSLPQNTRAIMPTHSAAAATGAGTVASPYYSGNVTEGLSDGSSVAAQLFRTGVSEDGNVNFGQAEISEAEKYAKDAGHASVYRYIIREYVPPDAENADGIKWSEASDEAKLEGGFTLGDVTYDGTLYYMSARVTSWQETVGGQTVTRYGLSKTYYTDDTYTTVKEDVVFASFINGYVQPLTLKVVKKSDSGKLLSGATFALTHAMKNGEGKWVPRQYVRDGVTVTAATRTAATSQGVLTFENLTEGHFILEETAAPAGYEKGSPSKWLLTLTKTDTASRIVLEPSIRPLNADGSLQEGVEPTLLTVENDNTFQYEVLNGKIPRGDIEVTKKWLRADGATAYTAEEIAQLGDAVQNTTITGELWRKYQTEVSVQHPTVTIYAKLDNQSNYSQKWQGRIEYGSDILYSMAVNSTGYPITQTTSTGATPVAMPDQNITYDNGINKPSGHVYALQNVTKDTQIYAEFDNSKANSSGIGFYLVSRTAPTTDTATIEGEASEKVADFTLNSENGWTVTWTSADLAEHDYDYEYYFQNASESALEDFTFVSTPEAVTDSATGKVTYSYKNISKGAQTDLTVRKVWTDGNDSHAGDAISYKIQRSEHNLGGTVQTEPHDYIAAGQASAQVYTLDSSDAYNGVSWQKHHDNLPADNGKAETDPDYRWYQYSVVEIVPSGYTVSYADLTDTYEQTSYDVKLLRNTPVDSSIGVEKKWMNAEQSEELTEGIPEGVYITGTLKRDYTHVEASGATVRVYFRSWSEGHANPAQLYRSYADVRRGTVFSLWAVDADGVEPIHGVTVNDQQLEQSGEAKTFHGDSWEKATRAFVAPISGDTEIILEWYDNTAYQSAVYYDVSYTQETGSGQAQSGTETVGAFRLDALNGWARTWTDLTLNEAADRSYSYYITDIQEHRADGTVVDHYGGFESPVGGVMAYDPSTQRWSATIINPLEPEKVPVKIQKRVEGAQEPLSGAAFTLTQVDENGHNVADGIAVGPLLTDENGELIFEDIAPGRYKLVETPPAGYVKTEGDYFIDVSARGEDTIEGDPLYIDYELANDGTHLYTVLNTPGAALPSTGGPGTGLLTVFGGLLVALSAVLLFVRSRRGI